MKRVVSVLLLVCMLVSLMGMSVAAYAEELPVENTANEQNTDVQTNEQGQSGGEQASPAGEQTPSDGGQEQSKQNESQETAEQSKDEQSKYEQSEEEKSDTTEKPADTEGFFAALPDAEVTTLMADLAKLGYTVTDRAGLYALAVQHGCTDIDSFRTWLDDELYLYDNAVAEVNGKLYLTLDEALEALDSARAVEIKLLKDTAVVGLEAPVEHELTLDLNGWSLTLAPYDDDTPSYITVDEADKQSDDNPPVKTHVHGALIIKNGIVNASYENADAIVNKGALTLIKVEVCGNVYVGAEDGAATLSIEPDGMGLGGYLCGNLDAEKGKYKAVSITGGKFITDVSAYIDSSAYECTYDETTMLYTVARIKGTSADAGTTDESTDKAGKTDPNSLPDIEKTEVKEGAVTLAAGVALENAAVELTGLDNALDNTGVANIIDTYTDTTPAGAPEVTDGTEMTLTVKAEVTAAEEGSYVSYDIKPIAVINDTEVEIDNKSLSQTMRLSFYTGFMPAVVKHIHDDGTVDTLNSTMYSYDKTTGMVTVEAESFSQYVAGDDELKTAIATGTETEITLSGNVTITSSNAPINVNRNLTIILDGHTLSMDSAVAANTSMFTVASGITLTIKGDNKANSKLISSGGYVANLDADGAKLVLGDEYTTNGTPMIVTANTTNGLVTANPTSVTIKCAKLNVDPSGYTVDGAYTSSCNEKDTTWTVSKYVAQITTTTGVIGGTTQTTGYYTLKEAITAAEVGDTIVLLDNIDEGDITINKSLTIDGTHTTTGTTPTVETFGITGNINITSGSVTLLNMMYIKGKITYASSDTGVNLTLTEIQTIGVESTTVQDEIVTGENVKLIMAGNGTVNGNITSSGSSGAVNINTLTTTNTQINGSIVDTEGTLTVHYATVTGDICSYDETERSVTVKNTTAANVYVLKDNAETTTAANFANATFTADNVTATAIIVGSVDNENVTISRSATVKECIAKTVTIGDGFSSVSISGLNNGNAATDSLSIGKCTTTTTSSGTSTGPITITGTTNKHVNIGTVDIADGNESVTIQGLSETNPTTINTVDVGAGSKVTFGDSTASSVDNDKKLNINTITSAGESTIQNGTYGPNMPLDDTTKDSLTPTGTGTFKLKGGNYHRDYSIYCACEESSKSSSITNTPYYDHYRCQLSTGTSENRYRVLTLVPEVKSVTPSTVVRGTNTPVQIVVNVPYTHACNGDMLTVTAVTNNRGTMAQSLVKDKDYTVTAETYKDANGNDVPTGNSVITISGDYVAANTYQNYFVDTQMGMVSTSATVNTQLARTNRSGLIRTGDDSNIGLLIGIMVLALAVVVAVVIILKKKKTQPSAPAQPEAKAKEPKKKKDKKEK